MQTAHTFYSGRQQIICVDWNLDFTCTIDMQTCLSPLVVNKIHILGAIVSTHKGDLQNKGAQVGRR